VAKLEAAGSQLRSGAALAGAIALADRSIARTCPLPMRSRTARAATPGPQPISKTRIPW
jgi:hypothetical protein